MGLAVTELAFLPLGQDSSAWAYKIKTGDGCSYFLKLLKKVANQAGLRVPRFLQDEGIAGVIGPLPALSGALSAEADGYGLILYPFVEGATGKVGGMSEQQWIDFGKLLRRIHDAALPSDITRVIPQESFAPAGSGSVRRLDAHIATKTFAEAGEQALAQFWQTRREEILTLLASAEELGQRLAKAGLPPVLCHADIHTNNVLIDTDGRLWIVDWDDTVLAPVERDLMFVVGGISRRLVGPREEAHFLRGYGATAIDPLALAYYRYAWAVSDIGAYGEQVFFRPDLGPATRVEAVDWFKSLFSRGAIVSIAFASRYDAA